ncbi:MAG TPA: carbohydrate ABC transporter permease [Nitrospirales bacterium]|nr:carbohydrate ABC transporter permease [Nitrospirales bacterium]HIC04994.1 carbohydrate ABC transporter permease [Nitrospirales bacterium]HIO21403.1 carbohydrate ABC transporter permease [Nitrospirales bacterium]HIO70177.1 carbohydrate ABC transporter permease [Nitrospirales bacterium]
MNGGLPRRLLLPLCVILVLLWSLLPILWQVTTSFKPNSELLSLPPLMPASPTFEHYRVLFDEQPFHHVLVNSTVVAFATTLAALGIGSLAAFPLARLPIRGKGPFLGIVLGASMFPAIVTVGPLFVIIRELGLRDTWWALVISHTSFSLPLTIWILTNFMRELPEDLYRASRIDGCTPWQSFYHVFLPLCRPGLAAAAILVFLFSWTEFLFALTFTATEASRTVPVAIALFPGLHEIRWGEMAAASVIVTIPVFLIVGAFHKHIVRGLTVGAVKG